MSDQRVTPSSALPSAVWRVHELNHDRALVACSAPLDCHGCPRATRRLPRATAAEISLPTRGFSILQIRTSNTTRLLTVYQKATFNGPDHDARYLTSTFGGERGWELPNWYRSRLSPTLPIHLSPKEHTAHGERGRYAPTDATAIDVSILLPPAPSETDLMNNPGLALSLS